MMISFWFHSLAKIKGNIQCSPNLTSSIVVFAGLTQIDKPPDLPNESFETITAWLQICPFYYILISSRIHH